MSKQIDWEIYLPWPWTKIIFVDGSSDRDGLEIMRRRLPNGKWEYRRIEDWSQPCDFLTWEA
jgi:hypothetical protein